FGIFYIAVRFALMGHGKALVAIVALLGVGLVLMSALNFGSRLDSRVSNSDSNNTRTALYTETIDGTLDSPLLGHGAPDHLTTSGGPKLALGSQGQLWTIMY